MSHADSPGWQAEVLETLRALGGQATLGDIVVLTGLSRAEVERALEVLLATDGAHVMVSASGDVIYHLGERPPRVRRALARWLPDASAHRQRLADSAKARQVGFDRKTLRLIRAREGIISLAELVEHTGLPLRDAEAEMRRLADSYGGIWRPSWDGHVVCAFPELMVSAHGRFGDREPRPAWVRFEDPIRVSRRNRLRETFELVANGVGMMASVVAPWLVMDARPAVLLSVVAASATGLVVFGARLLRRVGSHSFFRFRNPRSLRRYALGHVFETALAGKGVVSLDRTVKYLQARAGKRRVKRAAVEAALRELAREFEAPITEVNGELFFGFRNVKRQFLASQVQRREMQLRRTASGETIFDSADSALGAAERELAAFDRQLASAPPPPIDPLPLPLP